MSNDLTIVAVRNGRKSEAAVEEGNMIDPYCSLLTGNTNNNTIHAADDVDCTLPDHKRRKVTLPHLPMALWFQIFSYLDLASFRKTTLRTCRTWRHSLLWVQSSTHTEPTTTSNTESSSIPLRIFMLQQIWPFLKNAQPSSDYNEVSLLDCLYRGVAIPHSVDEKLFDIWATRLRRRRRPNTDTTASTRLVKCIKHHHHQVLGPPFSAEPWYQYAATAIRESNEICIRSHIPYRLPTNSNSSFYYPLLSSNNPTTIDWSRKDYIYYEVNIHCPPEESFDRSLSECIAVGWATKDFPLHQNLPGWDRFSIGFHSDDNGIYANSGSYSTATLNSATNWGRPGNTVGVGMLSLAPGFRTVFFTINGNLCERNSFTPSHHIQSKVLSLADHVYPVAGLDSRLPVSFNFSGPFCFDITHLKSATIDTVRQIGFCLS